MLPRSSVSVLLVATVAASPQTVEIAPGVAMALLNDGHSNDRTAWLQAGGTGLDTALSYGDADQQEVGQAVRNSGRPRSDFFVTTKIPCCPRATNNEFCETHAQWKDTAAALQHDLDMLGVEYIDLVLMHSPCVSLEEILERYSHMEDIVRAGKVRAIGVSNFNASLLDAFVPKTNIKPAVNQVPFSIGGHNLMETLRGNDDPTLAKCKELGITLSAYGPLGGTTSIDVLHNPQVVAVAATHNRSTAQIALRWLVQLGIPAVTSTDSLNHATADLAVYDFELSEEEMALLMAVPGPQLEHSSIDDQVLVV